MPEPVPTRSPAKRPLIARSEQVVLVALAVLALAGIGYRAARHLRVGSGPLEVVPPPEGPTCRVNANQADWVILDLVPGLGETLAKRIVAEREVRGGRFESLDDLKAVRGIDEKTLAKLRPYLYLADPDTDDEPIRMIDER